MSKLESASHEITEFDLHNIWDIVDSVLETESCEEPAAVLKKCKCDVPYIIDGTCNQCGIVLNGYNISTESEWNNYTDDCGNYQKNTQRCDLTHDSNPYSKTGTYVSFNKNTLLGKLALQQNFSHKQKTYWLIGNIFEDICGKLNLNKTIVDSAKLYWHQYMESGKLTRASVRKGLVASCLYYSCIKNNTPIERQEICHQFECSSKTLSKGEKILFEIIGDNSISFTGINFDNTNSFIRYCDILDLPFKVSTLCSDLFDKYDVELQAVSPKSAIAGIIAYVVKFKLNLKSPNKTVISATLDICIPTLNKVIKIIQDLENSI